MRLTTDQKTDYDRDGFLIYGPIISPREMEALGERIDMLASDEHPNSNKINVRLEPTAQSGGLASVSHRDRVWQLWDLHKHDELIFQHACNPKILGIVRELLSTGELMLFSDQTLMKPAFHGSPVSWHQDSGYWTSIEPKDLVSCWTALDEATMENGCLQFIPSSHEKGLLTHGTNDFLQSHGLDESQAVPVMLRAGECSFHHSLAVHASGENLTPYRRRGVVTSYMRADSKWVGNLADKPDFHLLSEREYPSC